jgi:hypothetical protein
VAAADDGPGAKTATAGAEFDRYADMTLNSSMLRRIAPLSLVLVTAACVDKASGTDSDSQGSESGTGGSSTTAVQPTSGGTADGGSTGGGLTGGMSDTGVEPGSTGQTTGGGDAELMGSCMDACGHIFECVMNLPGTVDDCMAGCVEQWGGPGCGQAGIDLLQCLVGMSCKQLQAYVEDDKAGVCAGLADAADAVCGGASTCSMGGGEGMGVCSVSRECDGSIEELQCDGTTCTCVVDGTPGESCEDTGVCAMAFDGQVAAAEACCGWVWS